MKSSAVAPAAPFPRAVILAWCVLASFAVFQVGLVMWGVRKVPQPGSLPEPFSTQDTSSEQTNEPQKAKTLADEIFPHPRVIPKPSPVAITIPPPPPRMHEIEASPPSPPQEASEVTETPRKTVPVPKGPRPFATKKVAQLVTSAMLNEEEGDLIAAINELKSANLQDFNHPEILYRLGVLYNRVGRKQKAAMYLNQVIRMKDDEVGGYGDLAAHYLAGGDQQTAPTPVPERPLSLGHTHAQVTGRAGGGRTINLTMSIRAAAGAEIDPFLVKPEIYFFDLLDGHEVEWIDGEQPQENPYRSEVVDYKDPEEELLDVVFEVPVMEDDSETKRSFFGYRIDLFYDGEIQDVLFEPRVLVKLIADQVEPTDYDPMLDDTLFQP